MSGHVDVLSVAMFEAYARNGGHSPDDHYDRIAGEQWMAQALDECGVTELVEVCRRELGQLNGTAYYRSLHTRANELRAALARLSGAPQ